MKSSEGLALSILLQGRNDSYMGNFLWRLSTCLNKHADNITRLGGQDRVEIVLTDWGSAVPLSQALTLTDQTRQLLRIVQVAPEIAAKYNQDSPYSWVHAVNTGARRCRGEFVLFCDSDGYLPIDSLRSIVEGIAAGELGGHALQQSFFVGSRYHIPAQFHVTAPSLQSIDEFIANNHRSFAHDKVNLQWFGGNAASYLWSRLVWEECRGFDERLIQWGWYDIDLFMRLAVKYRAADLEDLGIVTYHLEHYTDRDSRTAQKGLDRPCNTTRVPEVFAPNGPNWGLRDEPLAVLSWPRLSETPSGPEPAPTRGAADSVYFQLHKLARFLYLATVAIDRDGQERDRLLNRVAELQSARAAMIALTSTWASRQPAGDPALLGQADQLCHRGEALLVELFRDPRFQAVWQRTQQAVQAQSS